MRQQPGASAGKIDPPRCGGAHVATPAWRPVFLVQFPAGVAGADRHAGRRRSRSQ